jgi:hypothetical protein
MRESLVLALIAAAAAPAWGQEQPVSSGEDPAAARPSGDAGNAAAGGVEDADVGFGGPDQAAAEEDDRFHQLDERLRRLEQTVEIQSVALEQSRERLQQLEARLAQQEALSTTVEQRTIAAEQEQRVTRGGARAAVIQRALRDIATAQQMVQAGSSDVAAPVSAAASQLDSAATDAGRWGSDAEAGHLTEAAQLLDRVPEMVATRNFQNATVALFAAERRALSALALARSVGAPP